MFNLDLAFGWLKMYCVDPEDLALCKSVLATFDEHFKEPMTTVQHLRLMCYKLNKSAYQSVPFDT